jgi:hypothetical protein
VIVVVGKAAATVGPGNGVRGKEGKGDQRIYKKERKAEKEGRQAGKKETKEMEGRKTHL